MPKPPTPDRYADVAAFGEWLRTIFGSRSRGLANVIRSSPEFQALRKQVGYCAVCRQYVRITLPLVAGQMATFTLHHRTTDNGRDLCPGSDRQTRWCDDTPETAERHITQNHLIRLAGTVPTIDVTA